MEINICVIGGGSKLWALTLMKDLSLATDLSGTITLFDIDHKAAEKNVKLGNRIFAKANKEPLFSVRIEHSRRKALEGSDFVIISIEPGPIENRYVDLEIPRQFGIIQSVGDTIGPGGIFRAMRCIPVFRDYARLIKEVCPDAWVINYTNPMTWCTNTLSREFPGIKVLGCCHEVFGTQKFIAEKVAAWFDCEVPHHKEIKMDVFGLNHFTFTNSVKWRDKDLFPLLIEMAENPETFRNRKAEAEQRMKNEEWFESDNLIALDFLKNFGNLGAAGDRHLVEFVPWYLRSENLLNKYGVITTPYEWRVRNDKEKSLKVFTDEELAPESSEEEGVEIMKALLGMKPLYTNVNVPNKGQIPWLKEGHVVESNAYIDHDRIIPSITGKPTASIQSMIRDIAIEQELLLDAVFKGDEKGIYEAFLLDPLVNIPLQRSNELYEAMRKVQGG